MKGAQLSRYGRASVSDEREVALRVVAAVTSGIVVTWAAYLAATISSWSPQRAHHEPATYVAVAFGPVAWLGVPLIFRALGWRNLNSPRQLWGRSLAIFLFPFVFFLVAFSRIAPQVVAVVSGTIAVLLATGIAFERPAPVAEGIAGRPDAGRNLSLPRAPRVLGLLSTYLGVSLLVLSLIGMVGSGHLWFTSLRYDVPFLTNGDLAKVFGPMHQIYGVIAVDCAIVTLISAVLVAVGIGQIGERIWAWRWSLFWSAVALTCAAIMIATWALKVRPAYQAIEAALEPIARQRLAAAAPFFTTVAGLTIGSIATLCLLVFAPYPIAMLVVFSRSRLRASMAPVRSPL